MSEIFFTSDTHFGHANIIKFCCRPFLTEDELFIRAKSIIASNIKKNEERWDSLSQEKQDDFLKDIDCWNSVVLPVERVIEHDNVLIENWNNCVSPKDTVYHLGDFAFGRSENFPEGRAAYVNSILDRLNGDIHLILGNHENDALKAKNRFKSVSVRLEINIPDKDAFHGKQTLILDHYALRVWNHSFRNSWHLYGHSHDGLTEDPNSLSFDVGVDAIARRISPDYEFLNRKDYRPVSYDEIKDWMNLKLEKAVDRKPQ